MAAKKSGNPKNRSGGRVTPKKPPKKLFAHRRVGAEIPAAELLALDAAITQRLKDLGEES